MQDTPTITTTDGRLWTQASVQDTPVSLSRSFVCGDRRAQLFGPKSAQVARLITPSGKRLQVLKTTLPGAQVTPNGNLGGLA